MIARVASGWLLCVGLGLALPALAQDAPESAPAPPEGSRWRTGLSSAAKVVRKCRRAPALS